MPPRFSDESTGLQFDDDDGAVDIPAVDIPVTAIVKPVHALDIAASTEPDAPAAGFGGELLFATRRLPSAALLTPVSVLAPLLLQYDVIFSLYGGPQHVGTCRSHAFSCRALGLVWRWLCFFCFFCPLALISLPPRS